MFPLIIVLILAGALGALLALRRGGFIERRSVRSQAIRRDRGVPWYASRGRSGYAVIALIGIVLVWLLLNNLGVLTRAPVAPPGDFVVRIAPFQSSGDDQRQGTIVAEQLLDQLKRRVTTPMNIGVLSSPIASAAEAAEIARTQDLDVIIWGQTAAGVTAEQAGLRPILHWRPSQPFVPRTWQGYDGHFVLPNDYDLAVQDLNGPVVLAPILDGLNHFSKGDADKAADTFDTLRRDYGDVLRAELPSMIRAIVLWAEGKLPDAETEARTALESYNRPEHWNNLGALLLDQQKLDDARSALQQALTDAPGMGQAHANMGRLLMNEGRPADALPDLRSAADSLPTSPAVIAGLSEAYRRSGDLEQARATVNRVLAFDPENGPALAEQGMLALTPVTTTARLEWELEAPSSRTAEELTQIRAQTEQGVAMIEALRNTYLRQANAYGVSVRTDMQRLSEAQAAILEQELLNRRYQLMLVDIEQGRVALGQPRGRLRRMWDGIIGRRTPINDAIAVASDALQQQPSLQLQYDYLYQQGRAALLSENPRLARDRWDAALKLIETAPPTSTLGTRPEAHYGLAQLLIDENKRSEARDQLNAALSADDRYFPAHQLFATLADEDRRWDEAEAQYRWLVEHRPQITRYHLDLARVLSEQGKLADAEAQLLPLANNDYVEAQVQLAALYRTAGKLPGAQQVLQRALTLEPGNAAVHEELAAVALADGAPLDAEAHLRRSLEIDPQRSSAHIALGRLYAGPLTQPAAAADQFQAAVENNSTDPLVHRQLGEVLLQIGNPRGALESFQRALELDPNSHEAQHGLATAYLALGRYSEATRAEQKALEMANGNYTLATVGLADIAREERRYDEAVTQYMAAIERDPNLAIAYLGLGRTALAQGRPEIALEHFQKGLSIEPNNVPLLLGQGDALLQQNNIEGASAAYARVKQIEPANAAAHTGIGRALWRSGQSDAALAELSQAAQINPNDADTLLVIGEINAAMERNDAALDAYTKAAEVREDWYEPRFRRGVLLLKLEQTERATEDLEATVKLNDQFAQGHYWLGRAYRAAGNFSGAQRQLQRAIEQQGNYYEARYFMGRVLDELGKAPDAIRTYEAIIAEAPSGDPWRAEAQRELDRIR